MELFFLDKLILGFFLNFTAEKFFYSALVALLGVKAWSGLNGKKVKR